MSTDFNSRWLIQLMSFILLFTGRLIADETSLLMPLLAWIASIMLLIQVPYSTIYLKQYKLHVLVSLILWSLLFYLNNTYLLITFLLFAGIVFHHVGKFSIDYDESDLNNSQLKVFFNVKSIFLVVVLSVYVVVSLVVVLY